MGVRRSNERPDSEQQPVHAEGFFQRAMRAEDRRYFEKIVALHRLPGDGQDFHGHVPALHSKNGFQPVLDRQVDIENDEIGRLTLNGVEGLPSIRGFDDPIPFQFEYGSQPPAHFLIIVCNQNQRHRLLAPGSGTVFGRNPPARQRPRIQRRHLRTPGNS